MHVPAMCVFLWAWLMWISLGATVVSAATTATATATATSSATSGSAAASFAPEARTSQNSAPSADLWDSSLLLKPESAQSVVRTTAISAVGEGLYIAGSFAGGGFFAPFHDDQVHFTPLDPKSPGGFILYKASRNSTQFTWGRQITSESTDGTVHISDVAAYFAVPAVSAMEPSAIIAGTFTGSSFTLGTSGGKYITVTGERNHISLFVAQVSHSGDFIWAQSRPLVSSSLFNSKLFGVPDFESKVERGVDDSEDVNIKFGKEKHSTRLLELPVHVHVDAETNNVFVAGTFSGVLQWKLGEEYFAGISSWIYQPERSFLADSLLQHCQNPTQRMTSRLSSKLRTLRWMSVRLSCRFSFREFRFQLI
ncbi:hypothetical protein DFJ73DRAFT_76143 [Zopfochytrium polystomum]|nr:hypothetical protein DFJ73DRAFT_76143 [Zopfochytrium polystomum]